MSISLLLSFLLLLKKITPLFFKTFSPFLLLSIIVELIGAMLIRDGKSTTPLYNIYTTLEVVFYLWILLNILQGKLLKKILICCIIIYPAISLIDIYFIQGIEHFHSTSYSLGCLLLVLFSILYFFQLFARPSAIRLTREPSFWICTGLLMFYSISFPLFAFANFMTTFPNILAKNLQNILIVLNVLLYLLFSIAFLCKIRIRKS